VQKKKILGSKTTVIMTIQNIRNRARLPENPEVKFNNDGQPNDTTSPDASRVADKTGKIW